MTPLMLDTHAALWVGTASLGDDARRAIDAATDAGQLLLSPIIAWEIGTLVRKKRLRLGRPVEEVVRDMFSERGVVTAICTPAVACAAGTLDDGFHGDPADRIIVASAMVYGADLMTRDEAILRYARLSKRFRCIAC